MNIAHKKSILFGLILFLGIGVTANAFALPWGSILYHTSENGKMYGYNNFENSFISGQFYPGAVGIYIGKGQKTSIPLVVEVDYGEARIIPAKYFVDMDKGEEFIEAKIPKDFEYNHKIAKSIMRKIVAQEHEIFDYTYGDQKGPQSGEWTSVGFVEKIYESANAPHLTYHPEPLMNYSHYAINITPDGFDNKSEINDSSDCFSLSQEFSKVHKLGQGDFWEQFAFEQFKDIIKMLKTKIDVSKILTINIFGRDYDGERYFFFPATQLNQSNLKGVPMDIEIASYGKSQLAGGLSERHRQIDMIGAFSKRIVDETGKLCAKVFISKKFSFLSKISNFFSSLKSWLTIGKEISDLSDADLIKINLDFLQNSNPVDNLDAALGFWRKTQQFIEFGAKESDEIADLVNKGLLSGPKADAKIEELLSGIDISDISIPESDFIQHTDIEKDSFLTDFVGGEDFSDIDEIKKEYEEFILDLKPEEELPEKVNKEELDKDIIEEDEEEIDKDTEEQDKIDEEVDEVSPHQYSLSDIVINEFVSDPSTGETEWIELFNNTNNSIDLTNWTIEDNTSNPKALVGKILQADGWLILNQGQDFSFSLNNAGDIIKLKYNDTIIDQITYGNFDDGNTSDNAQKPSKGQSSARNIDGQDTDNDKNDFSITTTLTEGVGNVITAVTSGSYGGGGGSSSVQHETYQLSDIIINEIMYNPTNSDSGHEWIEIYNTSAENVDMTNWKFYEEETNHSLNLREGSIVLPSNNYAIIADDANQFMIDYADFTGTLFDSSFSLKNTSETIAIKDGTGNLIDEITYLSEWGGNDNAKTIGKQTDSSWAESLIEGGTPGSVNIFNVGGDGGEENGDGDAGVDGDSDGIIDLDDNCPNVANLDQADDDNDGIGNACDDDYQEGDGNGQEYSLSDIVINEFVSDPATGETEWIELFNNTGSLIDLTNWTIEDNTANPESLGGETLQAGEWLALNQGQDFSFLLNNIGDIIKLKYNDTIIDQVSYGNFDDGDISNNAPEPSQGQSNARNIDGQDTNNDQNDFSITTTITKGATNVITAPESEPEPELDIIAPEISLDFFPDSLTNQTSAQFEFSANEIVIFSCRIDEEELQQGCGSSQNYNGLLEGGHIFYLEAVDEAGNVSTKNHEWTIDLTAPISSINLANNIFNSTSWPNKIEGTASSNATTTSDILEVKIQVHKISEPQYLSNTTSTSDLIWSDFLFWMDTILGNTTSTTPTWSFDLNDSLLTDDYYSIYSQATDTFGNVQNSTSTADFIFDNTAPEQVAGLQIEELDTALDFRVSWDSVEDNLSGVNYYEISWAGNTTSTTDIFFDLTGEDGQTYSFKTRAIDKAGNQGQWSNSVEHSIDLLTVLLSEIQIADNEFVELYNPTNDDISLSGWYFAHYSQERDWDNPLHLKEFPSNAIIKSKDYYLVGLGGYLGSIIDWLLYDECQFDLSNEAGSIALYSYNPSEKTSEYLQQNYTDVFAWGNPQNVKELTAFSPIPSQNYSFERKQGWPNGNSEDTDNNLQDFFAQEVPNPQSSQGLVNDMTLFEDDFSDDDDDNWEKSGEISAWQVVNQKYQIDLNGVNLTAKALAGEDNWRNYQLDFDIIFDNGVDRSVLFGYQDVENYYQLVLKGTWQGVNPEMRLEKIQEGQNTPLSVLQYPLSSTFNDGQEHQFTIGINDDIIQVYLDSEKDIEYNLIDNDRIPQGKIGFGVHSGDAGSGKMSIDNIKVKTLFQEISLSGLIALPYEENFDGTLPDYWKIAGPNNCPTGTCPENAWQIIDNKYQIDLNGAGLYTRALTGSPDWEDYQLDVDITFNDGVDRYVILRYQAQENYYQINLRGYWEFDATTPAIYLDKIVSGQGTNLVQYSFPGKIYFNQNQEYHLTAVVNGNRIRIYVDGEKIIDYIDNNLPITYGKVGFAVSGGDSGEGDMSIDNLQVREISDPLDLPSISEPQLSENFDDGNFDGWQGSDYWHVINGQYGVSILNQKAVEAKTFIGDYSWKDYQMEFDITLTDGVDRYVMFRRADSENFYQLNFMGNWPGWNPKLRLYRASTQTGDEILKEVAMYPYTFNNNEIYHVKIIVQNENIKVYLYNGENPVGADPIIDITDTGTRLTRGNVGLGIWTGDYGNAVVYWDNIEVNPL